MTSYRLVRMGTQGSFAELCLENGFIGVDFGIDRDLTGLFPDKWQAFNAAFIPEWLAANPGKTKVAAGLSCGMLWTIGRGIVPGDVVVSPDANGIIHFGTVESDYYFVAGGPLPHRRRIAWSGHAVPRSDLPDEVLTSLKSPLTVVDLTGHAAALDAAMQGERPRIIATDASVEDPSVFALEKHLESFLVANWERTAFGVTHDIFNDDTGLIGQQYPTDTGPIDILAISKDKRELLVIELKRGRASDVVVGQIQRYMGFVLADLAEDDQSVRGAIVALDDDVRLKRALTVAPDIDFYRYVIDFQLIKVGGSPKSS